MEWLKSSPAWPVEHSRSQETGFVSSLQTENGVGRAGTVFGDLGHLDSSQMLQSLGNMRKHPLEPRRAEDIFAIPMNAFEPLG